MDIMEAKAIVVEAGKKLVDSGLIARTWGNVSCRISENQFVITPSGRAYETLTPDEIVLVNIEDLTYEGEIKPSSEKGIHAAAYKLRPEINFVIHTHQINASIVSALGMDINNVSGENCTIIGDNVPIASYGLPGTQITQGRYRGYRAFGLKGCRYGSPRRSLYGSRLRRRVRSRKPS